VTGTSAKSGCFFGVRTAQTVYLYHSAHLYLYDGKGKQEKQLENASAPALTCFQTGDTSKKKN